jgi:formate dehydrogenase alpha subunit
VVGLAAAFGSGAMTNSLPELANAKCIFIIGSNTTENHPIAAKWILRGREKGAKIIVVDPRATQMAFLADIAVQHRLGTDVALINGLMHIILKEGWHDKAYVEERTEGFEAMAAKLEDYPPDKVAQITGVDAATLRRMAEMFAKTKPASIIYCMGITQHTTGVDNVKSLANLAMLTGNVGVASGGVNPLRGQNNVQGACDMGGLPNVFTGYQPVADEAANKKFSEAWGKDLPKKPGLTILDMFHAIEAGTVKALYVVGENPLVTDPDLRHVEAALKHLDIFIVQDIFLTQTAKLADVVLPGTSFAEKDGTFSNTERRVLLVRQAIPPVGESRPDWVITQDLSTRCGYPMHYASPEAIFEEIKSLTPSYAGMSYARLAAKGLQWPCPTPEHPGTVFLHKDRFSRGKGAFTAIDYKPPAEVVDAEYPMWLSTGRSFAHYHSGSMTRVSPSLHQEVPEGYVEISPTDAKTMAIKDGERVKVSSRRGEIQIKAKISGKVNRGVVFIPFHFAETAANVLTNPAYDPVAKIPEYKVCAVKVEKLAA